MLFALTSRRALCTLGGMSDEIDVKSLREDLKWTQDQMAEYLGLDRSSVSRMETGQKPKGPTVKLLERLASQRKPSGARSREVAEQ